MSIFAIADLHLSLGTDKPMEVFGSAWGDYVAKLKENWIKTIAPTDTVVIGGDISWAMNDAQLLPDLRFLSELPGEKLLLRGNHDYWWQTRAKLNALLSENGIENIDFLQNCAVLCEEVAICGTKGYLAAKDTPAEQDEKLFSREALRLELSLADAKARFPKAERVVFFHYPPVLQNFVNEKMFEIMELYDVRRCFYGHLHAAGHAAAFQGYKKGIDFQLISADFVHFMPLLIN